MDDVGVTFFTNFFRDAAKKKKKCSNGLGHNHVRYF